MAYLWRAAAALTEDHVSVSSTHVMDYSSLSPPGLWPVQLIGMLVVYTHPCK